MIPETRKAIVSPGRIGEAPNRASRYPSRHSNNLPRNPRSRSPAPKRTRAATATLRCSPKSESLNVNTYDGTVRQIQYLNKLDIFTPNLKGATV